MKQFISLVLLVIIGVAMSALFLYWAPTKQAESKVIVRERNNLVKSQDPARMKNDPVYARRLEMRLRDLDYLLARAYNKENMPDASIGLLQKMISEEEANNKGLTRRRSRSCMDEARCYEALREAYALKTDSAGAEKADQCCEQLRAKARAESKREQLEEGISLRLIYGD